MAEDCPICGDEISLPFTLECKHRFCYLCIKRAYEDKQACPYCRASISIDIANSARIASSARDTLVKRTTGENEANHVWVYAGANCGFWQYSPRHSEEIEAGYQNYLISSGPVTIPIYIMNRLYTIDFGRMLQLYTAPSNGPSGIPSTTRTIRRAIRRVAAGPDGTPVDASIMIKGIAGLTWTNDVSASLTSTPLPAAAVPTISSRNDQSDGESDDASE